LTYQWPPPSMENFQNEGNYFWTDGHNYPLDMHFVLPFKYDLDLNLLDFQGQIFKF
jgi:hypothetical protein